MKAPTLTLSQPTFVEVEVELATSQFGGGALARLVDRRHWLRSAALRGAMRFWWRFEANYASPELLRRAELAIFGGATTKGSDAKPGIVSLSIVCSEPADAQLISYSVKFGDPLNGTYFAAAPMGHDAAKLLQPGATAHIRLTRQRIQDSRSHSDADDGAWKAAVRALALALLFGGSGARTRRAAGALVVRRTAASDKNKAPWTDADKLGLPSQLDQLDALLKALPGPRRPEVSWFSRHQIEGIFRTKPLKTADEAHRSLMEVWREFRQDRDHPGNWQGASGWGQSRWPEGDALRFLTSTHARWDRVSHQPRPEHRGRAPRSHLGLPIVIKFKDDRLKSHPERGNMHSTDPQRPTELNGAHDKGKGRYASPVWMSVTRVKEGYVGLVLVTSSLFRGEVSTPHGRLDPGPWSAVYAKLQKLLARQFQTIV